MISFNILYFNIFFLSSEGSSFVNSQKIEAGFYWNVIACMISTNICESSRGRLSERYKNSAL